MDSITHTCRAYIGVWDRLFNMCTSSRFSFKFSTHDVDDEYTEKVGGGTRMWVGRAGKDAHMGWTRPRDRGSSSGYD